VDDLDRDSVTDQIDLAVIALEAPDDSAAAAVSIGHQRPKAVTHEW
jgi:hypothetical protein